MIEKMKNEVSSKRKEKIPILLFIVNEERKMKDLDEVGWKLKRN